MNANGSFHDLSCELLGALVSLARATEGNTDIMTPETDRILLEGLVVTGRKKEITEPDYREVLARVRTEKHRLAPDCSVCKAPCGRTAEYPMEEWKTLPAENLSVKQELLQVLQKTAAVLLHPQTAADIPPYTMQNMYWGVYALGRNDWGKEDIEPVIQDLEEILPGK